MLAPAPEAIPIEVRRQLLQSAQGCDWLIAQWEGLGRAVLASQQDWDEAQWARALDLLGSGEDG